MTRCTSPLAEILRERIRQEGSIPFTQYMATALYHPVFGYYSTDRTRIGRKGDFFTNVSVGKLFGEALATQFIELFDLLGAPARFRLLEQGAETGHLAADIIAALSANPKTVGWEYYIVEPSVEKIRTQESQIKEPAIPVHWRPVLDSIEPFTGIIFCNELVDAFPCSLVEYDGENWGELCVTTNKGAFEFVRRPLLDPQLVQRVERLPRPSIVPYRTEINSTAESWIRSAFRALSGGYILVIDYGFSHQEFYSPARTEGTLTGYYRHQRQTNVLQRPGEIDITAHVNFSAIGEAARQEGCSVLGFTDQHHFTVAAMEDRIRAIEQRFSGQSLPAPEQQFLREFKSLMHPNTMGLAFKYLLLGKNVPTGRTPSGFKYGKDPVAALQIGKGP
jgi:SAM-dependent MidA family methyltransferase